MVSTEGKWHQGILLHSSKYPVTKQVLFYPSNLCITKALAQNVPVERVLTRFAVNPEHHHRSNYPIHPDNPKNPINTRVAFAAKKPGQMSFGKGDVIDVVRAQGKWHVGVLRKSTTQPITGQKLVYPSNFVKPYKQ